MYAYGLLDLRELGVDELKQRYVESLTKLKADESKDCK